MLLQNCTFTFGKFFAEYILCFRYKLGVQQEQGYVTKQIQPFHYVFRFNGTVIDYSYRKNEKQQLLFEKPLMDDALFFAYDYSKDTGDLSGVQKLDCVLKYVVNNTALPEDHPLRLMMRFVNNMLWFRSMDENRYIGYKSKSEDYYDFIFVDNRLELFETLLHEAGIPEKLTALQDRDGKKRLYFDTTTPLPFFRVASSGTKALYTFYYWYVTAKDVSLMFMDEFDAFYHYELAETVVSLIEKMPRTQVIVTSHNTILLSNRIMRPDCYFILTSDRLTSLANATMWELREGHNLEKLYMSGEFDG